MLNEVTLIGRLGAAPKTNQASTGSVTNLSIATNRDWKDKNNEWHKETTWHNVVLYGNMGGNIVSKLTTGSMVYVKGRIKTTSSDKPDGTKHRYFDIIAEDIKLLGQSAKTSDMETTGTYNSKSSQSYYTPEYDNDDIPF